MTGREAQSVLAPAAHCPLEALVYQREHKKKCLHTNKDVEARFTPTQHPKARGLTLCR